MRKMLRKIMAAVLWIWQLPQNLAGLAVLLFCRGKRETWEHDGSGYRLYSVRYKFGVSLGMYAFVYRGWIRLYPNDAKHEHGHQIQSRYLGPLYLILIGLPSALRNLYDRAAHKKWTNTRRTEWYYKTGFLAVVESSADRLGGVNRF